MTPPASSVRHRHRPQPRRREGELSTRDTGGEQNLTLHPRERVGWRRTAPEGSTTDRPSFPPASVKFCTGVGDRSGGDSFFSGSAPSQLPVGLAAFSCRDSVASEGPKKCSSAQDQSGLHMGLSDSAGPVGAGEDESAATSVFIGTSTTPARTGQERVPSCNTGARIKWKNNAASTCFPFQKLCGPQVCGAAVSAAVNAEPTAHFQLIRSVSVTCPALPLVLPASQRPDKAPAGAGAACPKELQSPRPGPAGR